MKISVTVSAPGVVHAGDLPPDYVRKEEKLLLTLEEMTNPQHTALIIVDVQNDFVYGKGKLSTPPGKANPAEDIISPLNVFIEKCRKVGVPVIYTFTIHAGDLDLPPYKARMVRNQTAPVCMKGSKGGEFPEKLIKPLPHESVVTKHGYDAFADHNLNTLLQNRGIKSLIFSGISTATCVDSTLRHGFHLGYYTVLAEDICAAIQPGEHEYAVQVLGRQYAMVTTTKGIMKIWDKGQ
jgi:nicotinamidase-related amidase